MFRHQEATIKEYMAKLQGGYDVRKELIQVKVLVPEIQIKELPVIEYIERDNMEVKLRLSKAERKAVRGQIREEIQGEMHELELNILAY
jgi:hypothetical protein